MWRKYNLDRSQASGARAILPVIWLVVVASGMMGLRKYSATPGDAPLAPNTWPTGSRIALAAGQPNLILFAHPRCPCTRATLGELERLMAQSPAKLTAQVWFIHPQETAEDWPKTDLWRTAAAIPGVTVHDDDDSREARRFQAETSGETLLYDAAGKLAFEGGITISRGHSGDNPGRDAVAALLEHAAAKLVQSPVFGCSLSAAKCQPASTWKR